nr:hypothetical protein [Tanacetum cinerariifolium]
MDLLSFIRTADPTKVRIGKRERDEDEPKLLETTVGRVVLLLPVAPDRSSGELEASVDKLFDEGGSGEQADQGDSAGSGHVVDAGEPSHPAKKLRGDYGVPGVPAIGGKCQSAVQRLLVGAVQHVEVRGGVMPTLPSISSSVSTTPEREGGDYTELLAGANLRTLESPQRFVIFSDSSDHSGVNIAEAEVDYVVRTSVPIMTSATTATPTIDPATISKERLVGSSVFGGDSSSAGGSHPISDGFSDRTGSDFIVSGIRTVVDPDSNLQRVYVSHWNVTNGFCMDDGEYNIKEKMRLKSVVEEKDSLLKSRCDEIKSLKAQLLIKEAEAAKVVRLRDEAQALKERNTNLEKEKSKLEVKVTDLAALVKDENMKELNEKFDKLCVDFVDMAFHLEEKFYPHLLTTIFGRRWLLTYSMELTIAKCLNSTEYLSALGVAISKAIEKGMREGLSAGITHGAGGRTLTNDASVEVIMNLLRLEDTLAEKLGLIESQPHVDQLMVPIHHSLDQRIIGASTLSLLLDVSSSRVLKIKENIANHVSTLCGVFVPIRYGFGSKVFLVAVSVLGKLLGCVLPRTQGCVLVLRFVSCDLALRFGYAFCLIEDLIAFCLGEALPNSKLCCVLSQNSLRFVSKLVAFCLNRRYARSRPNGKMIVDSIENEPYVRRMIATPGEPDLPVPVPESFHEQTNEELTKTDINCETAKEIWERVRQIMKGLDIGEQEKNAKLFNEWEKFTSTDGESIESYYHRFMQLMNDLKRNKHFPENIALNLKFLNNLQLEWKRHVTIVRQIKNLHEADFTQIYDFLKMNQDENGGIQVAQNAGLNAGVKSGANQNGLVVVPGIANQSGSVNVVAARAEGTGIGNQARCYNYRGLGHIARNCTARPRRKDAAYLQTLLSFMRNPYERGCNTDFVPEIRQLAIKDECGFVIHLESRLH